MAHSGETIDLSVLGRVLRHLEDGGPLTWVAADELPAWSVAPSAIYMGSVAHPDGSVQVIDGPWFGLRVVQLVGGEGSRRWRFATIRLPQPCQRVSPSLAHRLAGPPRFTVHRRRTASRRRRATLRQQASG